MAAKTDIDEKSTTSLGARLKRLRITKMEADQKSFAQLLGVSQAIVSQWENGRATPSAMALMAIGNLAGSERSWWYEQAGDFHSTIQTAADGYRKRFRVDEDDNRTVLVYGEVGTGPFRCIPEEVVSKISVPRGWFSPSAQLIGLVTKGDSMAPLINDGFIALVDRTQTEWSRLEGRIIAVGDGEGLTLKRLKKVGSSRLLVPENLNVENQIIPVTRSHKVFGRVERWIGSELEKGVEK